MTQALGAFSLSNAIEFSRIRTENVGQGQADHRGRRITPQRRDTQPQAMMMR